MKITAAIAKGFILGAALVAVAVMTGCTLTVGTDGTRTYSTDGSGFLRAIEIIATK